MLWTSRRTTAAAISAVLVACAACSLILDHSATQCTNDSDCAHFGSHPFCQNGVCVPSGLGPPDCFYGTPQAPSDFQNQCSSASCGAFDNCARLGLCNGASDLDALAPPPVPPDAGTSDAPSDASLPPALCQDPNNGRAQVIWITGSSNFPPTLAQLAPLLIQAGFTPVFQITNSCTGVDDAFNNKPIVNPTPSPTAKYATYYTADKMSHVCQLPTSGVNVDIGESDVYSASCTNGPVAGMGNSIGEYLGPIQAMAFVVPGASKETTISAEMAHAIFGQGGDDGGAAPWTNPSLYFVRNKNTGTQTMIGKAITVPAGAFWGTDQGTATNLDAKMRIITDPTQAEQAIGIISVDVYDSDRSNLRALAFKAPGQECAYLPDSDAFKKDKRNVRDGHYPIWGPIHFYTPVANGVPVSPGAQAFVSVVSVPNISKGLLDAFIGSSLVANCAMTVQRSSELGPLSVYSPPFQCGCYFEASTNGSAPPECQACSTANDCTDPAHPACNLGFCEVQ